MPHVNIPPLDGSLNLIPGFLDFHAKHNPDAPFAIFPAISGNGTTQLSYTAMSDASHRIAHILRPQRKGPDGEVVGLILHCDTIMYLAVLIGVIRAGMIVGDFCSSYQTTDELRPSFLAIPNLTAKYRSSHRAHAHEDVSASRHLAAHTLPVDGRSLARYADWALPIAS